jgi:uncharacterized protein (TIGR03435 family)
MRLALAAALLISIYTMLEAQHSDQWPITVSPPIGLSIQVESFPKLTQPSPNRLQVISRSPDYPVQSPDTVPPDVKVGRLLQAPQGARSDLNSLKGKVVILEFWATWCAPCISALPHLNALSDKFKDEAIFISITDEDEERVRSFLKRREIKGWVALDIDRSAFNAFQVTGIPRTFVIDQAGRITAITKENPLNERMLSTILKEEPNKLEFAQLEQNTGGSLAVRGSENESARLKIIIKTTGSPDYSSTMGPGRFTAQAVDLKSALSLIYNVPLTRIISPTLLQDARYDISASMGDDRNGALLFLLSNAIEASFGLKVHRETREMDVLVLTAPQQSINNLKRSTASKSKLSTTPGVTIGIGQEIQVLVDGLEETLNMPVVNETNLQGHYDWEILYEKENPVSIINAVRKDLGLQAERTKRAIEVLVVEIH